MARRPADVPWFRSERNAWYIKIGGKQYNLGPDRDQAETKLLELKLQLKRQAEEEAAIEPAVLTVRDVIGEFLDWCEKHREARTLEFYKEKTTSFLVYLKQHHTVFMPAPDLRPIHLQKWADSHDDWAAGQKRQAIMSVQRAFNWAAKSGLIERSPVRHVEKPQPGKRELVIEWVDHQNMLDATPSQEIKDLLNIAWETGARPQEIMRVEARHVDLANRRWVFPKKEAKGKKRIRIVYLTDLALEITKRLMEEHPEGKLFRNTEGRAWTRLSVNCVMIRLAKKTGKKFALVDYRHSLVTRAIKKGVDPITLGNLCGHADVTMIARVYSHLSQDGDHLMKALNKANG